MNRFVHVAAVAALLPLAVACGDDGEKKQANTPPPSPKPVAAQPPPGKPLTQKQLTAALLKPADIPTGFRKQKASASRGKVTSPDPRCTKLFEEIDPDNEKSFADAVARNRITYESNTGAISQVTGTFRGAQASKKLTEVDTIMTACKTVTLSDPELSIKFAVGSLQIPKLGGQSAAFRLTGAAVGRSFTMDLVFVRVKSSVTMVMNFGLGTGDTEQTVQLSRKATQRLRAAG